MLIIARMPLVSAVEKSVLITPISAYRVYIVCMNLNVPTDNLYKFMSIFGIVLLITAFTREELAQNRFVNAGFELSRNTAQLEALLDGTSEDIRLNTRMREIKTLANNGMDVDDAIDGIRAIRSDVNNQSVDVAALKEDVIRLAYLKSERERLSNTWVHWLGWLFSIGGFVLWFFKVQTHEDTILKSRAKRESSE